MDAFAMYDSAMTTLLAMESYFIASYACRTEHRARSAAVLLLRTTASCVVDASRSYELGSVTSHAQRQYRRGCLHVRVLYVISFESHCSSCNLIINRYYNPLITIL